MHVLPHITNFTLKTVQLYSNTNICLHSSVNWTCDNAVRLLWRDRNYAIFKETFCVDLLLLRSAGYFGGNSSQLISGQASLNPDPANIPETLLCALAVFQIFNFFLNSWPKTGEYLKCNNFNPNVLVRSSEGVNFDCDPLSAQWPRVQRVEAALPIYEFLSPKRRQIFSRSSPGNF